MKLYYCFLNCINVFYHLIRQNATECQLFNNGNSESNITLSYFNVKTFVEDNYIYERTSLTFLDLFNAFNTYVYGRFNVNYNIL